MSNTLEEQHHRDTASAPQMDAPLSPLHRSHLVEQYHAIRAAKAAARPTVMPGILERVGNFATSAIRHVSECAPRCTDEEVAARHDICTTCEYFANHTCTKCGCGLSRERAYISKLSWAGESCPVGKWGPIVREKSEVDARTGAVKLDE